METINKDILIRASKGDVGAFEFILSFYEKAVYNYCLSILKNPQNTKDVVQETFIKVYKHRKSINPEKNIKTWIFTIATNTVYDFLRSKKRKNEISLDEDFETNSNAPAYYSSKDEGAVSDVGKALARINPMYNKVILLYYQQGFAYKEIADMLLMPINTVKTHIARGKEELKEILKNYGQN